MWKNKYFWFCALAAFFVNGLLVYIMLRVSSAPIRWEGMMFGFSGVSLFTSGAFAAMFLGEEYSDNTIRNKLIIGKTRTQIFFANTITTVIGGLCMLAAEKIFPLSIAIFGGAEKLSMSTEDFALGILIYVCAVTASCVFFSAIETLVTKQSSAVVLTLALTIIAYIVSPMINNKLEVPQTITINVNDENGQFVEEREEANPDAVTGVPRVVLETVYNTLSFGQLTQITRNTDARPFLPLYSLGTVVVTMGVGALMYRRKDLK